MHRIARHVQATSNLSLGDGRHGGVCEQLHSGRCDWCAQSGSGTGPTTGSAPLQKSGAVLLTSTASASQTPLTWELLREPPPAVSPALAEEYHRKKPLPLPVRLSACAPSARGYHHAGSSGYEMCPQSVALEERLFWLRLHTLLLGRG